MHKIVTTGMDGSRDAGERGSASTMCASSHHYINQAHRHDAGRAVGDPEGKRVSTDRLMASKRTMRRAAMLKAFAGFGLAVS
jgi:hypothetical protein